MRTLTIHPNAIPREVEGIVAHEDAAWGALQERAWASLRAIVPEDARDIGQGAYARVRALTHPPGWVIKVTSDVTEAAAWRRANQHLVTRTRSGLAALPHVPGVWAFPEDPVSFALLQERCVPLPEGARDAAQRLLTRWGSWLCQEDLPVEVPAEYGADGSRHNAHRLYRTIRTLRGLGLRWRDPSPSNLMLDADGYWCLVDLGGFTAASGAVAVEVPLLDMAELHATVAALPVRTNGRRGWPAAELREDLPALLPADAGAHLVATHRRWVNPQELGENFLLPQGIRLESGPLGCGGFACAWRLSDRPALVVKITTDDTEAAAWARVRAHPGDEDWALARTHYVFAIPSGGFGVLQGHLEELDEECAAVLNRYMSPLSRRGALTPAVDSFLRALPRTAREQGERLLATLRWLNDVVGVSVGDVKGDNVRVDWDGSWRITDLGVASGRAPTDEAIEIPPFSRAAWDRALGAGPGEPVPFPAPRVAEEELVAAVLQAVAERAPSEAVRAALLDPENDVRGHILAQLREDRFPLPLDTPTGWTRHALRGALGYWSRGDSSVELAYRADEGRYTVTVYDGARLDRRGGPTRTTVHQASPEGAAGVVESALARAGHSG